MPKAAANVRCADSIQTLRMPGLVSVAFILVASLVAVPLLAPHSPGAFVAAQPAAAGDDPLDLKLWTENSGWQIREYCSQLDSEALAAQYKNLSDSRTFMTQCPSHDWLAKLQELDPSKPKTFIDIGCNKGHTSAGFFGLWAPDLNFNPATLSVEGGMDCGVCGDCHEKGLEDPSKADPNINITVYCVEPNLISYAKLILAREKFLAGKRLSASWHIINAAMSDATTYVNFPRCPPGDESCNLQGNSDLWKAYDSVPLLTVEDLVKRYNMDYIDVLKTDTEGNDVPALYGALPTLIKKKVGIYTFEYNGIGAWVKHKLEDVVTLLDGIGYACYFDGRASQFGSVVRLTGCWNPSYEFHLWANVVCVNREHVLYPELELLSTRYIMYSDKYLKKVA